MAVDSTSPQSRTRKKSTPQKSDSESVLTPALQNLISNKPDPLETAPPVIKKWINSGWLFFRRGEHESFLVAWHVGEILSAVRKRCEHGRKKNWTGPTWPEWVSQNTPFKTIETANRWADMFEIVKPETVANFDGMTINDARKIVDIFKGEQSRNKKRIAKETAELSGDENESPEPQPEKEPPPLGNVISAVRLAAGKLAPSLEFYGTYSSHKSPLRDGDKIKSWIDDNFLAAAEILAATETLNTHLKSLLGSRHKTTTEGAKIIREIRKQFDTARREFERLSVKGDA